MDKKTFGRRFREAREAAKLSQPTIAAVCNNSEKGLVSNWERGENWPSTEYLIAALKRIGRKDADANYILGLTDKNEIPSPVDLDALTDCIEAWEAVAKPGDRALLGPNGVARLIRDIYENLPADKKLTIGEVIHLKQTAISRLGPRHGRSVKKSSKASHRRRTRGGKKKET